jgi:ubiquinone/menaquinone biosynthesis C-methylase UbiE
MRKRRIAILVKAYKGMGMEGSVARWYESTTKRDLPEFQRLARRIAASLADGGEILEVAPGPGFLSVELAKENRFAVTGLDVSRTFVEIARKNAVDAGVVARFERGDAAHMPFPGASFDFVVCRAAFKNFSDPVGALREMHRVLKPGGEGLIIDLRRDASMRDISTYVDRLHLGIFGSVMTRLTFKLMLLKRAYSQAEMQEMLRRVPFATARVELDEIGFEARFTRAS